MNLVQMFRSAVVARATHPCLRYKRESEYVTLTYEEVWSQVVRMASGLARLGVKKGDKVGILADNCPEWAITDYAVLALGAVVVPIYPSVPPNQIAFILQNAEVAWLFVGDPTRYQEAKAAEPNALEGIIMMHGDAEAAVRPAVFTFAAVLDFGTEHLTSLRHGVPYDTVKSSDLATIVHTSGTSGTPKGVMLTHDNLVTNVWSSLSILKVYPDDIALSYLPLSHIFERTVGQFALLSSGACVTYAESIEKIRENLLEVQPTLLVTVPRLLEKVYTGIQQKVAEAPTPLRRRMQQDFGRITAARRGLSYQLAERLVYKKLKAGLGGRMRTVVSGGAGLAQDITEFYLRAGITICEGYGMTESSPVIAVNRIEDIRPGTVGKPIPNVEVRLAEDGELQVKGPNVMSGYYRAPAATASAITPDGWLCTGDIAHISEDGYVQIVDRKKNILVLATGKNVAPFPIENAITLSPYIADAVLIGDGRKYVTCLIVPDDLGLEAAVKANGLAATLSQEPSATWLAHPVIAALLTQEIARAVAPFAEFEQPKRAYVCTEAFSIEAGDLTPTMKVRTAQILKKFGSEIDAMYQGRNCLWMSGDEPVPEPARAPTRGEDSGPATSMAVGMAAGTAAGMVPGTAAGFATDATVGTRDASGKRQGKRRVVWTVAAVIVLLAGIAAANPKRLPPALNLLGNIIDIHRNNDNINQTNQNILSTLQHVNTLSGDTSQIGHDLGGLDGGLQAQNGNLSQLSSLSQTQVQLSQQLHQLATGLTTDLNHISADGHQQASDLQQLDAMLAQISTTTWQITTTNHTIAQKLNTAAERTHVVANEMP